MVFFAGLFIGCATEGLDGGGIDVDGKADVWGENGSTSHLEAVMHCERMSDFALEHSVTTQEITQAINNYQDCLLTINNRAREIIEQNLADIESPEAGGSQQTFADFRWAAEGMCNVSMDWSNGSDSTVSQIVRATCLAESERALSDLIDAFVYFGDSQQPIRIEEDRQTFAGCYEEQDAALENTVANNEMIQVMHASADCIESTIEDRIGALVEATLFNFPDRDVLAVEGAIRQSFETMFDLNSVMCSLVSEAGESGGVATVGLGQADCRSDAHELMYKFVGMAVEGEEPDAISAHLEQGQRPLVHPTLGVWALYAPGVYADAVRYDTLDELFAGTPGSLQTFEFGTCMVQEGTVEFDCEEFSASGCFMSNASGLTPLTRTLQIAEEYELYTPSAEAYAAAAATELHFESFVVVTNAYMGLYYGEVDGDLVLLAVDLASFSCDV